jgi:Nucleotidyl transferase of unknown function (DUF2204)
LDNERDQAQPPQKQASWPEIIPDEQWAVYWRVIQEAHASGLRFAIGGAVALAAYTGRWRDTKDIDLYVLPTDRDAMIQAVTRAGLGDYHQQLPYDRAWIYRAHEGGTIVDIIWQMANQRAETDEVWLTRGPEVRIRDELLRVIPAEEILWNKLYIVQRERCDWPDVLNLLYATGTSLNWEHLLARVEDDTPLLRGVVSIFAWLCPGRAHLLPHWLWERLHLPQPAESGPDINRHRVDLMDTRPWFGPAPAANES